MRKNTRHIISSGIALVCVFMLLIGIVPTEILNFGSTTAEAATIDYSSGATTTVNGRTLENTLNATATFYDYYYDNQVDGTDSSTTYKQGDWTGYGIEGSPYSYLNAAVSGVSGISSKLYMGAFVAPNSSDAYNTTAAGNLAMYDAFYWTLNLAQRSATATTVSGLVDSVLDSSKNITSGGVTLPYFDSDFLTNSSYTYYNTVKVTQVQVVYSDNTYTFNAGSGVDASAVFGQQMTIELYYDKTNDAYGFYVKTAASPSSDSTGVTLYIQEQADTLYSYPFYADYNTYEDCKVYATVTYGGNSYVVESVENGETADNGYGQNERYINIRMKSLVSGSTSEFTSTYSKLGDVTTVNNFPFYLTQDTTDGDYYYVFDSSDSTNVVYVDKNTSTLTDKLRDGGTMSAVKNGSMASSGQYGFFPFNNSTSATSELNYGFGMTLSFSFDLAESGKNYVQSTNSYVDQVFEFSGDDDVWIFLDGVLVLDLGGDHGAATGSIDFATGTITYNQSSVSATSDASTDNTGTSGTGVYQVSSSSSSTTTLYAIYNSLSDSNKSNWSWWSSTYSGNNGGTYTWDEDTSHTITVFYMERGMYESNLKMSFNLSALPNNNTLTIKEETTYDDVNEGLVNVTAFAADMDVFTYTAANNGTDPTAVTTNTVYSPLYTYYQRQNTGTSNTNIGNYNAYTWLSGIPIETTSATTYTTDSTGVYLDVSTEITNWDGGWYNASAYMYVSTDSGSNWTAGTKVDGCDYLWYFDISTNSLSSIMFGRGNSGGTVWNTLTYSGTVSAGDVFTVADTSAVSVIKATSNSNATSAVQNDENAADRIYLDTSNVSSTWSSGTTISVYAYNDSGNTTVDMTAVDGVDNLYYIDASSVSSYSKIIFNYNSWTYQTPNINYNGSGIVYQLSTSQNSNSRYVYTVVMAMTTEETTTESYTQYSFNPNNGSTTSYSGTDYINIASTGYTLTDPYAVALYQDDAQHTVLMGVTSTTGTFNLMYSQSATFTGQVAAGSKMYVSQSDALLTPTSARSTTAGSVDGTNASTIYNDNYYTSEGAGSGINTSNTSRTVSNYYDTTYTVTYESGTGTDVTATTTTTGITTYDYGDSEDKTVKVTQTYTNDVKVGSLAITKKLAVESETTTKKFGIAIKLTNIFGQSGVDASNTDTVDYTIYNSYGTTAQSTAGTGSVAADGSGTITISAGQTIVVDGIPVGTTYTITEADNDSFELSGDITDGTSTMTEDTISVTVTNKRKTGELTVSKAVSGTDSTDDEFSVTVVLTGGSEFNLEDYTMTTSGDATVSTTSSNTSDDTVTYTITIKGGQSLMISGIPYGTTYTVTENLTETQKQNWTSSLTNDTTSGTIDSSNTSATVSITNAYAAISATVKKVWQDSSGTDITSNMSSASISYKLQYSTDSGSTWNDVDTTYTNASGTLSSTNSWTATVTGLSSSSTVKYQFVETNSGTALSAGDYITVDGTTYAVSYSTTTDSGGNYTTTITNKAVPTYTLNLYKIATPTSSTTLSFSDVVEDGAIKDDYTALSGVEFEIEDSNNNTLYFTEDNGSYAYYGTTSGTSTTQTLTTDTNGKITVTGLLEGTYTVTETKTKSGYTMSSSSTITVAYSSADKATITDAYLSEASTDYSTASAVITNTEVTLPDAGGLGGIATDYVLYGFAAILISGIGVILINRKKIAQHTAKIIDERRKGG